MLRHVTIAAEPIVVPNDKHVKFTYSGHEKGQLREVYERHREPPVPTLPLGIPPPSRHGSCCVGLGVCEAWGEGARCLGVLVCCVPRLSLIHI